MKHLLLVLLLTGWQCEYCLAEDVLSNSNAAAVATQVVDYENHVREIAKKTAEDAKARKAQERINQAKVSSLNVVPVVNASTQSISTKTVLNASTAAFKGAASSQKAMLNPKLAAQSAPSSGVKPIATGDGAFRVFKYKKDGATMFADSVPYKTKYEVIIYNSCYACSITSSVNWYNTRLRLNEFADTINHAAKQYNVDAGFIRAIIHAESAFNPLARSRKGAMGLMQLMPGTAKDMGVVDLTNPEQNIQGGVKYLARLLQTFSGNETLAAAAYNAGPGAVARHGGIPPYEETQTYVKRVKILADRYKTQKQLAMN